MLVTRRSLLIAPVAIVVVPVRASFLVALGEFIIELFFKVLQLGIELLLTSAAKHIYDQYLAPAQRQQNYIPVAQGYLEQGHAADNFCPYSTVEYANKSKRFWNGQMFEPNEENHYYRAFGQPTDHVLLELTQDSDAMWYLDSGRNRNAHLPTGALDQIRERVRRLENDKAKLYYSIEQHTLDNGQLDQYLIPKAVLREIDKAYQHVTSEYHRMPEYVDYVIELQKFATWFNTRLIAISTATSKGGLIA